MTPELAKQILRSIEQTRTLDAMVVVLHDALLTIKVGKQIDPKIIADEALSQYREIFEKHKQKLAGME